MTPIILLDRLAEFVEEATKDIILQCRVRNDPDGEKGRPAAVYKMRLPKKEDEVQRVPYILLQLIGGSDEQESGKETSGSCQVRVVVTTYSEDGGVGAYDVLNVILRIRSELEKQGVLAKQFELQYPVEYIVYPDSTRPYYTGEMMTNWNVPAVRREVYQWL